MTPRTDKTSTKIAMNFKTMAQVDVPQGRNGKHKQIVTQILSDLDQTPVGIGAQDAPGRARRKQGQGAVGAQPGLFTSQVSMWPLPVTTNSCTCGTKRRSR